MRSRINLTPTSFILTQITMSILEFSQKLNWQRIFLALLTFTCHVFPFPQDQDLDWSNSPIFAHFDHFEGDLAERSEPSSNTELSFDSREPPHTSDGMARTGHSSSSEEKQSESDSVDFIIPYKDREHTLAFNLKDIQWSDCTPQFNINGSFTRSERLGDIYNRIYSMDNATRQQLFQTQAEQTAAMIDSARKRFKEQQAVVNAGSSQVNDPQSESRLERRHERGRHRRAQNNPTPTTSVAESIRPSQSPVPRVVQWAHVILETNAPVERDENGNLRINLLSPLFTSFLTEIVAYQLSSRFSFGFIRSLLQSDVPNFVFLGLVLDNLNLAVTFLLYYIHRQVAYALVISLAFQFLQLCRGLIRFLEDIGIVRPLPAWDTPTSTSQLLSASPTPTPTPSADTLIARAQDQESAGVDSAAMLYNAWPAEARNISFLVPLGTARSGGEGRMQLRVPKSFRIGFEGEVPQDLTDQHGAACPRLSGNPQL